MQWQSNGGHKLMEINNAIQQVLHGFWPENKKLTMLAVDEMISLMAEHDVTEEEFRLMVKLYRGQKESNGYTPGNKVPIPQELIAYLPKCRSGQTNLSSGQQSAEMRDFNHHVVYWGWSESVRVAYDDLKQGEALRRLGVDAFSEPYCIYEGWFRVFIEMLHSGQVVDAWSYATENTKGEQCDRYRKQHQFFENVKNDQAKTYFLVLATKVKPISVSEFKQCIKNKARSTKNVTYSTNSYNDGAGKL